jgi:hypothetical protein
VLGNLQAGLVTGWEVRGKGYLPPYKGRFIGRGSERRLATGNSGGESVDSW